jgi:nitroreductase/dihydropteridine reductase
MSLIEDLNWRYATKKMNGQRVPQEKVDAIVAAAHLAPTSSGLQPFKVIVVSNPELKERIKTIAFGQSQITDSSHILVFAAWDSYTEERIRGVYGHANSERGVPDSANADFVNQMVAHFTSKSPEESYQHAARQSYIGFGLAIAQAAELKVDATPMEGFDPAALDEILGLKELGLRSTTILPLGYRDAENDWLVNLKKVRSPFKEFAIERN